MKTKRHAALLAALFLFAAAGGARADEPPCDKNHYILKHPCEARWTAASEGLVDKDVRVVAVDSMQPTTVYAAGGFGVFKSLDEGRSWRTTGFGGAETQTYVVGEGRWRKPLVAGSTVRHVLIDPRSSRTLYVATAWERSCHWGQRRLYRSTDGGESWDNSEIFPAINGCDDLNALALAPSDPSTIYLANFEHAFGDSFSPVARSTDGAATWDFLGYPVMGVLAVDPRDSRTVYGGTFDFEPYYTSLPNGVLKSRDGGVTWAATGLTGSGITALAVDPREPGTLYAAKGVAAGRFGPQYEYRGLMKSLDGGVVWTDAGRGLEALYELPSPVTSILVDTDDPGVVYLGTASSGVFRSVDAGATWEALNEGLPTLGIHSLALVPGRPNTLYAGTPLGVFRIVDFPPSRD